MRRFSDLLCRAMDALFPFLTPLSFVLALGIAFCAGFVKGVVGFAMPLVFVSGLTTFMSAELALAGLILPTLIANVQLDIGDQGSNFDDPVAFAKELTLF